MTATETISFYRPLFCVAPAKRKQGICIAFRCFNKRVHERSLCYKHKNRWLKFTNPRRYRFDRLKSRAKERGKVFTLTFAEFKDFCDRTGYMETKGKLLGNHIDCKIAKLGYTAENIRILDGTANRAKYWTHDRYDNYQ